MKYPKFLNDNNKVLFVSPSFGCTTEPYKSRLIKAKEVLKGFNLEATYGKYSFQDVGGVSATAIDRAFELEDGFKGDNQMLLSVGGGFLEGEMLDFVDFEKLKTLTPKWFMGYSDNTYLTFTLTTLCDIATIYGANGPDFGTNSLHTSQIDAIKLIKGEKLEFEGYDKYELDSLKNELNPYLGYNLTEKKIIIPHNYKAPIRGRMLGGCIDCLTYLVGTKYDEVSKFQESYKDDGIIWFLESCDLEAWNLRLALLHMKRAGWFKNAKGFIFGRCYKIDNDYFGLTMHDAIIKSLEDLNLPILLDCDFGHLKPQIPIICGSLAEVEFEDKNIKIKYELK